MAKEKILYWLGPGVVKIAAKTYGVGEPLPATPYSDKELAKAYQADTEEWVKSGKATPAPVVATKGRPTKEVAALKEKIQTLETQKAELAERMKENDGKIPILEKKAKEDEEKIAELEKAVEAAEDDARKAKAALEAQAKTSDPVTPEVK